MRVITTLTKPDAPAIEVRTHGKYGEMYALVIGDKIAAVADGAAQDRMVQLLCYLIDRENEGYETQGAADRASGINREIQKAFEPQAVKCECYEGVEHGENEIKHCVCECHIEDVK